MQTTISGLVLIPFFLLTVFYVMKYKVKGTLTIYQKITVISCIFYSFAVIYLTFFPSKFKPGCTQTKHHGKVELILTLLWTCPPFRT